ncbi:retrovirus-related pol polyprotein from transposon TNT 1-94 [Tanacetum coccineum]
MAAVEVPQTIKYRGCQLNAAPVLEVENFTNWKKRNTNHVKDSKLASLFGKLKYEENLIDSIYETKKSKSLVSATPLSTAFLTTSIVQDFQDSPDDEEDTKSSHGYLNDLEEEYQARALLAKSKRFFKKGTQRFSSAKATDQTECHKCGKKGHFARDCWSKTSVPSYQSPFQLLQLPAHPQKKGLIAKTYDWYEEEVSSDDNEVTEVKALMALTDEENVFVGKESANNGEWVKISIQKVHTLLEMEDNNDRKSFLDYLCIDLNYVEEQRNNLLSKHRNLARNNFCEQIPTQKRKILGIDQLTEDTSSSGPKDPVFVKSSVDNSEVSITSSNKPKLSETEDSTLSNHDTGKVPSNESQRNTTDHSAVVSDSSATNYDSADESSYHTSQSKSSSRSRPSRSKIPFSSCIHCGYNDHQSNDYVYYPICEIRGRYDHDTHGNNRIISLRRGIKPRNPQHIIKNYETCGSNVHTISDHNDVEWFRKRDTLQAKKAESFKASKTESSNALRSKTPTKRWVSKQN